MTVHANKTYARTWLALVVLAAISVAISGLPLGAWSVPLALAIAVVKALLIVLFFMHLIDGGTVYRIAAGTAFVFIVLLSSLMATDVVTRNDSWPEEGAIRLLLE